MSPRSLSGCGTRAKYTRGCRCEECRRASSEYVHDQRIGVPAEVVEFGRWPYGLPPGPWVDEAACRGLDSEVFFPTRGERVAEALAICERCAVVDDCREYAVVNRVYWGIWGGTTARERRRMRYQRKRNNADSGRSLTYREG